MSEPTSDTLWHGRFELPPSAALQELNDSLPFDQRMFREDIDGSRAHARMLCDVGLLDEGERDSILSALEVVEAEFEDNNVGLIAAQLIQHRPGDSRTVVIGGSDHTKITENSRIPCAGVFHGEYVPPQGNARRFKGGHIQTEVPQPADDCPARREHRYRVL